MTTATAPLPTYTTITLHRNLEGPITLEWKDRDPVVVDLRLWAIGVQLAYAAGWRPEGAVDDTMPSRRVGYLEPNKQRVSANEVKAIGKGILNGINLWLHREPGQDALVELVGLHQKALLQDYNWLIYPAGVRGQQYVDLFALFRGAMQGDGNTDFEGKAVVKGLRRLADELKPGGEVTLRNVTPPGWYRPGVETFPVEVVSNRPAGSFVNLAGRGAFAHGDRLRLSAEEIAKIGPTVRRLNEDGTPYVPPHDCGCPHCSARAA